MKTLPLFIPKEATVTCYDWLEIGYNLVLTIGPEMRDYVLPRPAEDLMGFFPKVVTPAGVSYLSAALMADLRTPALTDHQTWTEGQDMVCFDGHGHVWTGHVE